MTEYSKDIDLDLIQRIVKGNDGVRKITVRLTDWCNYRCSYCIQSKQKKEEAKLLTTSEYIRLADMIRLQLDALDQKEVIEERFNIMGGEVGFIELDKVIPHLISDKTTIIGITTNLSNIEEILKVKKIITNVIASYHEEFADFEKFKENFQLVKKEGIKIKAEFVLHDGNIEIAKKLAKWRDETNSDLTFNLKRNYKNGEKTYGEVTQKSLDFLNEYDNKHCSQEVFLTLKNGTTILTTRDILNNKSMNGGLELTGWLCKKRGMNIRVNSKGILSFGCGYSTHDYDDEIICERKVCGLCGNLYIEKLEEDK